VLHVPKIDLEKNQICFNFFQEGSGSDCHGTFVKERWLGKPDVRLDRLALWDF
jgi:hypothetical protein